MNATRIPEAPQARMSLRRRSGGLMNGLRAAKGHRLSLLPRRSSGTQIQARVAQTAGRGAYFRAEARWARAPKKLQFENIVRRVTDRQHLRNVITIYIHDRARYATLSHLRHND
jgi:hypothetical protein